MPGKSGFSGTVGTEYRDEITFFHIKVYLIERFVDALNVSFFVTPDIFKCNLVKINHVAPLSAF